jgi:hypothetical protein
MEKAEHLHQLGYLKQLRPCTNGPIGKAFSNTNAQRFVILYKIWQKMKSITIKFEDAKEWQFLLELLKRLNLSFDWKEEAIVKKAPMPPTDPVSLLFGSFPSDKSSDELVQSIYGARMNQTREINL